MSNGANGLFVFIEQGTDPTAGDGFDAPINSLCTFNGAILQKTGDAATAWTPFTGGGFDGGTVPDPTTFESDVTFEGDIVMDGGAVTAAGALNLSGGSGTVVQGALTVQTTTTLQGAVTISGGSNLTLTGGGNVIAAGAAFGTDPVEIDGALNHDGTAVGFYGAAPVVQHAAIPDAAGGATIDAEARAAVNAALDALRDVGLIAT